MFTIDSDNRMYLTRGDTARFPVIVQDGEYSQYILQPDDQLKFSVKKCTKDTQVVLQKTLLGTNLFHIEPQDTKGLSFGRYVYDVELTLANGDIFTIITPTAFNITEEVG